MVDEEEDITQICTKNREQKRNRVAELRFIVSAFMGKRLHVSFQSPSRFSSNKKSLRLHPNEAYHC